MVAPRQRAGAAKVSLEDVIVEAKLACPTRGAMPGNVVSTAGLAEGSGTMLASESCGRMNGLDDNPYRSRDSEPEIETLPAKSPDKPPSARPDSCRTIR